MKKSYRKIIVDNKEYDWLYISAYNWASLKIFKIEYQFDEKSKKSIRKRRFLSDFDIQDFCGDDISYYDVIMTPKIVKKFIEYVPGTSGTTKFPIITKKFIRKQKLEKIRKINE